ncbi:MAG: short-chain dehydrogenase [endosymbiont of Galathealinum brachiosum]|uniref:Short-chain dehydrogenase n=1 Tax=endosymbiont of Galathealinum brachiosum TaxID=2200906 RepID=A0A370DLA0_9GAMM|nr:MAG: short-chain dehydrogenase [endosymbiont of Galathealinum brachiosum]
MKPQKSILITGCSTGIGFFTAQHLQKLGYQVFASARKADDVEHLKQLGLNALQLDLNDSLSIKNALIKILDQTQGKLFALFNNGAYGLAGAVEDLSRDAMRAQFETNLFGTMELTNLVLPVMRKQGYGRIIQNSSVLGFAAMPYRGAYNCSKFALEGISDTLRQELNDTDIHVSLIEPGPIVSDFRKNALKAFNNYIDKENSQHKEQYESMLERLEKEGPAAPFTLGPEAVCEKVIHAMEAKRPRARYYVTKPTYIMGYLKRILSSRMMDKFLIKAGGGGKR